MSERESNDIKIPSVLRKDSLNCLAFSDQVLPRTEISGVHKITEEKWWLSRY